MMMIDGQSERNKRESEVCGGMEVLFSNVGCTLRTQMVSLIKFKSHEMKQPQIKTQCSSAFILPFPGTFFQCAHLCFDCQNQPVHFYPHRN